MLAFQILPRQNFFCALGSSQVRMTCPGLTHSLGSGRVGVTAFAALLPAKTCRRRPGACAGQIRLEFEWRLDPAASTRVSIRSRHRALDGPQRSVALIRRRGNFVSDIDATSEDAECQLGRRSVRRGITIRQMLPCHQCYSEACWDHIACPSGDQRSGAWPRRARTHRGRQAAS